MQTKKNISKILLAVILFMSFLVFAGYFLSFIFYPKSMLYFYRGNDEKSIWVEIKPFGIQKKISQTNYYKSNDLKWAPDGKHLAFFDMTREKNYDKEWSLKIINPKTFQEKTIFIGTYKTSRYEWLSDNSIRVYIDAGTGVRVFRDIDINVQEPFVAINNVDSKFWTLEKVLVSEVP